MFGACRGWDQCPSLWPSAAGATEFRLHGRFELLACYCDALLCGWDWVGQRVLIPVPPRLSAWVFVSLAQLPLASLAHVLMPSLWSCSAGEFLPALLSVLCSLASKTTPTGQVRSDPRMILSVGATKAFGPLGVCDLICHVAVSRVPACSTARSPVSCSHTCSSKQDVEEPCIAPALFRGVAPGADHGNEMQCSATCPTLCAHVSWQGSLKLQWNNAKERGIVTLQGRQDVVKPVFAGTHPGSIHFKEVVGLQRTSPSGRA